MSKVLVFNDYGGPEQQELIQSPVSEPAADQLAVRVVAAGVNPVDWKIRAGLLGRDRALPAPMGREASGVVTAVGPGVSQFSVGDEVLGEVAPGHGGFAEHTILRADKTVAKPEEVGFAEAATIPIAGATAYDVTHQIELEAGQTLLIVGAGGGVGQIAAQIGKVHQFTVLGVASASKREVIESSGAVFIESGDGVADRVAAAAPDGVDLVVDLVGGDALRAVAPAAKDPSHVISTADPDTVRELGGVPVERTNEGLEKITDVIGYGLVAPTVTARYSLDDAARAIDAVENGHTTGKIVIEP